MDGWMDLDFTSLSTVFQSYQDDGWVIMKDCLQWAQRGHEPATARSVGQRLTH